MENRADSVSPAPEYSCGAVDMMNRAVAIYCGVLITVIASMFGLSVLPDLQLRTLPTLADDDGILHPTEPVGQIGQGRAVFIDLGCIYCHSQQVRPEGFGADLERGWGTRRSVARDYIFDAPPLLGTMRTGPDLANIGMRQPSEHWHYTHLYDPTLTSPGSIMPKFPFLFKTLSLEEAQVIGTGLTLRTDAIELPDDGSGIPRYIVPTERAAALVSYLRSLDHSYPVPEVK